MFLSGLTPDPGSRNKFFFDLPLKRQKTGSFGSVQKEPVIVIFTAYFGKAFVAELVGMAIIMVIIRPLLSIAYR